MTQANKREQRVREFYQMIRDGAQIEGAAKALRISVECAMQYLREAERKSPEEIQAEKQAKDEAFAASVKALVDSHFSLNGICRELRADRKRIIRVIAENNWNLTWSPANPKPVIGKPNGKAIAAPIRHNSSISKPKADTPPNTGKRSRFDDPIDCRRCRRKFKSWGPGNRLCADCRKKANGEE